MVDLKISDDALADIGARLASLAATDPLSPYVRDLGVEAVGSLPVADAMTDWQRIFVRAVHEVRDWVTLLRGEIVQVGEAFAETDLDLARRL